MRYRTIVADPPWPYEVFYSMGSNQMSPPPYPTMTLEEIAAIPVPSLRQGGFRGQSLAARRAAGEPTRDGSTLFLWTTQRFLRDAYDILAAWRFTPVCTLVWCKPASPNGKALFYPNTEFVLVGRHGSPRYLKGGVMSQWFQWSRGRHSQKPEAFLDLVESISPGPYLELFARRNRLGWDTWGNEALEHIEMSQ